MKTLILSSLGLALGFSLVSQAAFAAVVDKTQLPANIICSAPAAKVRSVRGFKITKLNEVGMKDGVEAQPESSFRMGFQEMSEDEMMVTISFSDECEGWYAVYFKEKDLRALKTGQITRLTGELEYDDLAEFFPGMEEENGTGHDRTAVTCKVAKTGVLANRYEN